MWPDEDSRGRVKTAGDAWRLVLCFPKLRSGLFEEQGTPYSTEWFQIDFDESEQVWEGPLVPFKINLELFSSFRGSLLPKQITGKKLHFRKHGTGKKTAGDAWRLVSCFPKLRSGLFEEQGTPYSDTSIKNTVLRPNRQYKASTAEVAEYRYS